MTDIVKLTEKNKRLQETIAEFMDLETPDGVYYEYLTKEGHRSELTHFMLLEYHMSWDWLMPVVSKCFKTGDDTHQWDNIMDAMFTCDINIVYAQVVEFIKQYNDEKN
jgi:hypothetical protein